MHRRHPLPTLAVVVALGAGCNNTPPPSCRAEDGFACFTGVFEGLLGKRLEGVEVCAPDLPDVGCTRSDADGGWKLPGLPLDSDVLVTAHYDDAVPTLFPQHTSKAWYDWYKVMVPTSIMNTHAKRLDTELDDARGHLIFLVWEGLNIDGDNTKNVKDVTARVRGGRVFYANSLGLAASDLDATTGSGSGGALNLDPGMQELVIEGPAGPCEHSFSYDFAPGQPVPVPIEAGYTTAIDVICPPGD